MLSFWPIPLQLLKFTNGQSKITLPISFRHSIRTTHSYCLPFVIELHTTDLNVKENGAMQLKVVPLFVHITHLENKLDLWTTGNVMNGK